MQSSEWKAAWITAGGLLKGMHYHVAMDVLQWIPSADGLTVGAIVSHPNGRSVQQFWPGRSNEEGLTTDYGFYKAGAMFDENAMKAEWQRLHAALDARHRDVG